MKKIIPSICSWLALGILLTSCDRGEKAVTKTDSGGVIEPSDFEVGEYNKDGRLVFWEINAFDHMEPFVLYEDYGVMLINEGGEGAPSPLYILAVQKTKEVITTNDFDKFKKHLSQIPNDVAIGKYGTCSLPSTWGLPDQLVASDGDAITALESTHKIEHWSVCYCPNRN